MTPLQQTALNFCRLCITWVNTLAQVLGLLALVYLSSYLATLGWAQAKQVSELKSDVAALTRCKAILNERNHP